MDNEYYKLDLEDLGKVTIGKKNSKSQNGSESKNIEESYKNPERQVKFAPLRFTKKNRDLILACIKIDSTYRRSFDKESPDSSANYIAEWFSNNAQGYKSASEEKQKEIIYKVCSKIDRENSTHLSVSSSKKGDNANKGVEIMAHAIFDNYSGKDGKPDILSALKTDTDGRIVYNISQFVSDQNKKNDDGSDKIRNDLSFASKFCSFMCRYAFDEKDNNHDKYSIYDSVLCNILPYYVVKYQESVQKYLKKYSMKTLPKNLLTKPSVNTIKNLTKDKVKSKIYNYNWYRSVIDGIRAGIKEKDGLDISREEFDLMLWYYYKGDNDLIGASYAYLRKKFSD